VQGGECVPRASNRRGSARWRALLHPARHCPRIVPVHEQARAHRACARVSIPTRQTQSKAKTGRAYRRNECVLHMQRAVCCCLVKQGLNNIHARIQAMQHDVRTYTTPNRAQSVGNRPSGSKSAPKSMSSESCNVASVAASEKKVAVVSMA
jgi:hypothetical protein